MKNHTRSPKKLFIHVGIPKAASTTIQSFWEVNTETMRKQGIFYPDTHTHRRFADYYALSTPEYIDRRNWNDGTLPDELHKTLRKQIEQTDAQVAIISSEYFWHIDKIEELRQDFDDFDVHIIAVLRRQDKCIESHYGQLRRTVIRPPTRLSPSAFAVEAVESGWYDYDACLKQWAQRFGQDHVHPVVLESHNANSNRVIEDVNNIIGLDLKAGHFEYPGVRNKRRPRRVIEYIYKFPAPRKFVRRYIVGAMKTYIGGCYPDPPALKHFLSPSERRDICAHFQKSNEALARTYLGRDELFSMPWPEIDEPWERYKGLSVSETLEISGFILKWYCGRIAAKIRRH